MPEEKNYDSEIVYSKREDRVLCTKVSDYYKVNFAGKNDSDLETITISSQGYFHLFNQISPRVVEWPMDEVRKWEVKRDTAQINQISLP